jgi:hypothetical protein
VTAWRSKPNPSNHSGHTLTDWLWKQTGYCLPLGRPIVSAQAGTETAASTCEQLSLNAPEQISGTATSPQ